MLSAAVLLVAAATGAAAMPHHHADLNATTSAIMKEALHGHRLPSLDTSKMRLRNVNTRRNWEWSDCSSPGSSVVIRDITVVP
jgi:hypothetical protein